VFLNPEYSVGKDVFTNSGTPNPGLQHWDRRKVEEMARAHLTEPDMRKKSQKLEDLATKIALLMMLDTGNNVRQGMAKVSAMLQPNSGILMYTPVGPEWAKAMGLTAKSTGGCGYDVYLVLVFGCMNMFKCDEHACCLHD
jgi:hypothetical protein